MELEMAHGSHLKRAIPAKKIANDKHEIPCSEKPLPLPYSYIYIGTLSIGLKFLERRSSMYFQKELGHPV